jgi:hypothetical protein
MPLCGVHAHAAVVNTCRGQGDASFHTAAAMLGHAAPKATSAELGLPKHTAKIVAIEYTVQCK